MFIRDKLSFPISCDRLSIAGDSTVVGTVAGMSTNDRNAGTTIVLRTILRVLLVLVL